MRDLTVPPLTLFKLIQARKEASPEKETDPSQDEPTMLGQKQKYDEKEKHDKLKLDAQKMSEDLADVYKGPTPKTD